MLKIYKEEKMDMDKNIIDEYGLFLCEICSRVMILAKDEKDAEKIFESKKWELVESSDIFHFSSVKIEDVKEIPEECCLSGR